MDGCHSRVISQEEDGIGLNIMKEAYKKYGTGTQKDQAMNKMSSKGAERVIVVSYEGLMAFRTTYLLDIYQQLGIRSSYIPAFIDENARYIRTPPPAKKTSGLSKSDEFGGSAAKRGGIVRNSIETNERAHVKHSEENVRF
jgi:hypothetical protein